MRNYFFIILIFTILPINIEAQGLFKRLFNKGDANYDIIINCDGNITKANIRLVTNDYVYYYAPNDSSNSEEEVIGETKNIYMIKFAERGNLFFSELGEIFLDDDNGEIPANASAIYMKKREEIIGYGVKRDALNLTYYTDKEKKNMKSLPIEDVFLIMHPNQESEIINHIYNEQKIIIPSSSLFKDEFVEIKNPQPVQEYIIKTKTNITIRAMVIFDCDEFVSYYRKGNTEGLLYRMNRKDIKTIKKVAQRRSKGRR